MMFSLNVKFFFSGLSHPQVLTKLHLSILQLLVDCVPALRICQTSPKDKVNQASTSETQLKPVEDTRMDDKMFSENNNSEEIRCQTENLSFEDEESQDKIKALYIVFEKKLHSSLMSLIKINSSSKSSKKR